MKKWLITKTIIEKCLDCYDKVWVISEKSYCCPRRRLQNIKDINTIPSWCPLEDYKEEIEGKEEEMNKFFGITEDDTVAHRRCRP